MGLPPSWGRVRPAIALLVVIVLGVSAFFPGRLSPVTRLTVLAGSELRHLLEGSSFTDELRSEGIVLDVQYAGSLEGADRIARGEQFDIAWFGTDTYLKLVSARTRQTFQYSEPVMESPVALGVKRAVAEGFGWKDRGVVPWKDIVDKAGSGRFRFAMTDAVLSNSGFSALVGAATAASPAAEDGSALCSAEAVDSAPLKKLFFGNTVRAPGSGELDDAFLKDQDRLDGLVNYESEILALQRSDQLRTGPISIVYPQGTVYATYPVTLLDTGRAKVYGRLVEWLHRESTQQLLTHDSLRRPVPTDVTAPDPAIPPVRPPRTPLPCDAATITALLDAYLDRFQGPSHTIYLVDVSRSMAGDPLQALSHALIDLTGGEDPGLAGQFVRFRSEERVTIIPFATTIRPALDFDIPDPDHKEPVLDAIRSYAERLSADQGVGTVLYEAVLEAYRRAQADTRTSEGFATSIVLMSDGENFPPQDAKEFETQLPGVRAGAGSVRTFAVRFGTKSDLTGLQTVADDTGGKVFQADITSLSEVFRLIRGYR